MKLIVKKLSETSKPPLYGDELAAGADLYANEDCIIKPGERACIGTGIAIEWVKNNKYDEEPESYYMKLSSRSGLSKNFGIEIGAGILDPSYRGEIKVMMFNHGEKEFIVSHGDRICQGILTRITRFSEIEFVDELSETERGQGGFGSTGTK